MTDWTRPPPKPPQVYHGCLRKEAMSERDAACKARRLGKGARAYWCGCCGHWHVAGGKKERKR
jgi:hypothetical protein